MRAIVRRRAGPASRDIVLKMPLLHGEESTEEVRVCGRRLRCEFLIPDTDVDAERHRHGGLRLIVVEQHSRGGAAAQRLV